MKKHKHFRVKGFLNVLFEAEIHAVPKKKWISLIQEKNGKTQKFLGFLNISG